MEPKEQRSTGDRQQIDKVKWVMAADAIKKWDRWMPRCMYISIHTDTVRYIRIHIQIYISVCILNQGVALQFQLPRLTVRPLLLLLVLRQLVEQQWRKCHKEIISRVSHCFWRDGGRGVWGVSLPKLSKHRVDALFFFFFIPRACCCSQKFYWFSTLNDNFARISLLCVCVQNC